MRLISKVGIIYLKVGFNTIVFWVLWHPYEVFYACFINFDIKNANRMILCNVRTQRVTLP